MPRAKLIGRLLRSALLVIVVVLAMGGVGLVPDSNAQALSSAQAERPSGQWSMFMNGPLRRGRTPIVGAQSSHLAWRIPTETNYGGPVVGRDGTIYQGTFSGQLLALNPDGTTKWAVSVPYIVESTPAILADGRIAFVDDGGTLYVVNPDGSRSWRFRTGTACVCLMDPAIGRDGTIYTGINQTVYALHPDGSIRWTYDAGGTITGPVSVTPDGSVYFPSGYLYALDPNGSLLWRSLAGWPGGAPSIGSDGTIYINSFNPAIYALNPDGSVKWSYQAGTCCNADVPATPAIGRDGTIYVGEYVAAGRAVEGLELALNPDGSLKWETRYGVAPTAPSIGGDGTVYFGSGSDDPASVYALNPDGTLKWQYDDPGGGYVRTTPAIGLHHRIYAGSLKGFFAIGP